MKEVLCEIMDAAVQEKPLEDGGTEVSGLLLLARNLETGTMFKSVLPEPTVRQLLGVSRAMQAEEMTQFAKLLMERDKPFRLQTEE